MSETNKQYYLILRFQFSIFGSLQNKQSKTLAYEWFVLNKRTVTCYKMNG